MLDENENNTNPETDETGGETSTSQGDSVLQVDEAQAEESLNVGGQVNDAQPQTQNQDNTLHIQEKKQPTDKKIGQLEQNPEEGEALSKREKKKFQPVNKDISQYLWDEFLKLCYWSMEKIDDGIDYAGNYIITKIKSHPLPKREFLTPAQRVPHAQQRCNALLQSGKTFGDAFAGKLSDKELKNYKFLAPNSEGLKSVLSRASKVAYDLAVAQYAYKVMKNDAGLDMVHTSNEDLKKNLNAQTMKNFRKVIVGVMSTSLSTKDYLTAAGINGKEQENKAFVAVNHYLNIMEVQAHKTHKAAVENVNAGNFAANQKAPTDNLKTELNLSYLALDNSQNFGELYIDAVKRTAKMHDLKMPKSLKQEAKDIKKSTQDTNIATLTLLGSELEDKHADAVRRREEWKSHFRNDLNKEKTPANEFDKDVNNNKKPQNISPNIIAVNSVLGARRS